MTKSSSGRIVIRNGSDSFAPAWSVTVIVEANVPARVPVPVIAPVDGSSVTPGGSAPALANV